MMTTKIPKCLLAIPCALALLLSACGGGNSDHEEMRRAEDDRRYYVIGTNPNYPPMQMVDPDTGEMVGFEIDLMNAIAEAGGFEIRWRSVEWRGIFAALDAGDIDAIISAATITEERRKRFDFSNPYFKISQRVVVRRDDLGKVSEISDLDDKTIGVQLATTGQILVEEQYPHWDVATYNNAPLAFADLRTGRIFGFMVDEPVAEEYGRVNPEAAELFAPLPFIFSEEEYGIVVRKNQPRLLNMINEGLRKVQEAGIDIDLQEKWIQ
ncbi:MAG: basic amino acid ABC transporter substrate-binding protein [Candidatus Sumerlaeia bacterium]|nr:basic amino acid ABC transporter substrate-binding protein [Candidatus Sumerlaeia bacterium]